MSDTINTIGARATRPVLIEYTEVLTALDAIIAAYDPDAEDSVQQAHARQVANLMYQLGIMENMGLSNTADIQQLVRALNTKSANLLMFVNNPGSTLTQIADAYRDWLEGNDGYDPAATLVNAALNPENWDSTLQVRPSVQDVLFYEYYRQSNADMGQMVGLFGNRLQVSEKFLDAINKIYEGATWNPGEEYIDIRGQLIDPDAISGDTWYAKWDQAYYDPNSLTRVSYAVLMQQGFDEMESLYNEGLLPEETQEREFFEWFRGKWLGGEYGDGEYDAGGTNSGVRALWEGRDFKRRIENAIQATTHFNERAQHNISHLLFTYDSFTRTASTWASRMNTSVRGIAKKVDLGKG